MKSNLIPIRAIEKHIAALAKIGNLGPRIEDGFFRAPWSAEESAAMQYFADYATDAGFNYRYDAVGNLFIRYDGSSGKILQVASHLDTVPNGGLFDGGAGIIAGMEALLAIKDLSPHSLELVVWRAEESAVYRSLYMGSRAAFGIAETKFLCNLYNGKTMEEAIKEAGYLVEPIVKGQATVSHEHIDSILAHIELHIEQARRLEIDELDIGIVTSIRAPRRYRIEIRGESAHSGATPMGSLYRKDANLALNYMGVRLNEALNEKLSLGHDLVQTIGVINANRDMNTALPAIYNSAITKVSELAYFFLDIRGNTKSELDAYTSEALSIIQETAKEFDVSVDIEVLAESDPQENLNAELIDTLATASAQLGYSFTKMPSGAGHDAVIVSQQQQTNGEYIPTSMIFIPCKDGISHNPREFTSAEAIQKGAQVIAETFIAY